MRHDICFFENSSKLSYHLFVVVFVYCIHKLSRPPLLLLLVFCSFMFCVTLKLTIYKKLIIYHKNVCIKEDIFCCLFGCNDYIVLMLAVH